MWQQILLSKSLSKNLHTLETLNFTESTNIDPNGYKWHHTSLKLYAFMSIIFFLHWSGILSHKITVNGIRLHFETTGDGHHTVLLLPGALGKIQGCEKTYDKVVNIYS